MENQNQHLENLNEIRSIMERSTRFISLSGLSGVFAGIYAIIGAIPVVNIFGWGFDIHTFSRYAYDYNGAMNYSFFGWLLADAAVILILAIGTSVLLTIRKAKKNNQPYYDKSARRLLVNMFLPLAAGGIFCLLLVYHGGFSLVAPATLLFYGLALFNAGKYTLNDIRYLGLCEMLLGLVSSFYTGFGILFWIIGFGLLHILYGIIMYIKYER